MAAILAAAYAAFIAAIAWLGTRPVRQRAVFGPGPRRGRTPADVGLRHEVVEYAPDRTAWYVPADEPPATVVLVHGFGLTPTPLDDAPGPLLEVMAILHGEGLAVLAPVLGYVTGVRPYTGGPGEAADVRAAVAWARTRAPGSVVLWGFSAGGHTALSAAATDGVAGVVADSAFADAGAVIAQQGARMLHLPELVLRPAVRAMPVFSGSALLDVAAEWRRSPLDIPVLLIHGDADTAISPANLVVLAEATGGEAWLVPGADHVGAFAERPDEYTARALAFVRRAVGVPSAS